MDNFGIQILLRAGGSMMLESVLGYGVDSERPSW